MPLKVLFLLLLTLGCPAVVHADGGVEALWRGFSEPQDSARTKVWWFFGETPTTREGITADLQAFKEQGVGGVVYYDQVHGNGEGADKVFDSHWWQSLIFASQEAKRFGLSFEVNIGNGYVAGGAWITPDRSMQRLTMTDTVVSGPQTVRLPLPHCPYGWHEDVAVLAVPYRESLHADSRLLHVEPTGQADSVLVFDFGRPFTARSVTYEVTGQGKARVASMQVPWLPDTPRDRFFGCGFRELPTVGVMEVSDDGTHYRKVCDLRPRYQNMGGLRQQTIAFPTTRGRYFRLTVRQTGGKHIRLSDVVVSARARVDDWEKKASLVADYIDREDTPVYDQMETMAADSLVDLTDRLSADGTLRWADAPGGQWLVMRFVAVSTGGRTKHGRKEALSLECDKLSVEGARLHWQSYTKPVIDSIRAHGGALEGICMDSHEAGPQNWTHDMPQQFRRLRGYDIRRYLPTIAGGMIVRDASAAANLSLITHHSSLLRAFRRTISDLVTTNYYGEFNRLCREEGLVLTAQAIGNALGLAGDNIAVKQLVDKPQGEFWGYQTEGNYDIKDCSSAAHIYGKQIASGEAFTDITYRHSPADIKNLADYAYAFGINEFVVCASAYQNGPSGTLNTANGRQYALNRMNTQWPLSRAFWDYQARCSWLLRQGKPASQLCVYLGDNVPKKILAHLLPPIPQGYDFDAFTTDALLNRMTVRDGRITLPDGVSYAMMLLPGDEKLTPTARQKVDRLVADGAKVWDPHSGIPLADALREAALPPDVDAPSASRLYTCHRQTAQAHIYFLNNHSDDRVDGRFVFCVRGENAERWDPVTGERTALAASVEDGRTAVSLTMAPRESFFVIIYDGVAQIAPSTHRPVGTIVPSAPWLVQFDAAVGGPAETVVFDTLTDWTHHSDPRINCYAGTADYRTTFTIGAKDRQARYRLSIGRPGSVAQVFVNGREAGTIWCSPWTVDISPYIKRGKNDLLIRVANSLWNRLVGDARRTASERIMQQTTPLADPTDTLVPSGLTGPVEIICQ